MGVRIEDAAQQWSGVDSNPEIASKELRGEHRRRKLQSEFEESVDRALPRPVSPPQRYTPTKGPFIVEGKKAT